MYPLVDFITEVKKIEYVLALLGIAAFLVFWEFLKPAPFATVAKNGREDLNHVKQSGGFGYVMKKVGRIVSAPFIGIAYVVVLPFAFFVSLAAAAVNAAARIAGKSATFEWRPVEAYLAGRKKKKEKKKSAESGKSDVK